MTSVWKSVPRDGGAKGPAAGVFWATPAFRDMFAESVFLQPKPPTLRRVPGPGKVEKLHVGYSMLSSIRLGLFLCPLI